VIVGSEVVCLECWSVLGLLLRINGGRDGKKSPD